ncbi:CAP domain-containing protein [Paenibacillus macerans]|uniref:CAP domain-containing protein n=1 Tax=Paenibacillus macerans TaxID=44252 RepID=UPI00203B9A03|nr:CAP domain-containing protein [Paenibacillus macerans]MCM3698698.1 CAP domain-containing protein [Paenibacillus macerans]
MAKYIILAVILLVSGCSTGNNAAGNNAVGKTTSMKAHTAAPTPVITQASSIATSTRAHGSVRIKETPDGLPSNIGDFIPPAGNPANQAPANPTNQIPSRPTNPTPATPSPNTGTTGQAQDSSKFAQQVLDLVNKERSKAGLGALTMSPELANMAMVKAQDMYNNNYFDHNSPTHGSPFDMMKEFGITYNSAGENIAKGQSTPTQVMNDWMNSPGHKANILNSSYTKIGVAYYNSEWVQEFTG